MDYLIPPERLDLPDFLLRMYSPTDGPLLNEAVNSSYEHLREFMPFARPHTPLDDSVRVVRRFCGDWLLSKDFIIGVFSPDGSQLLGSTGYMLRGGSVGSLAGEIGMWIRASVAGCGLGTQVLTALLRWGFTEWPWQRLEWHCDARNLASARVAEKAGMLREALLHSDTVDHFGCRRDTLIFGALRDEWLLRHDPR